MFYFYFLCIKGKYIEMGLVRKTTSRNYIIYIYTTFTMIENNKFVSSEQIVVWAISILLIALIFGFP